MLLQRGDLQLLQLTGWALTDFNVPLPHAILKILKKGTPSTLVHLYRRHTLNTL
jgi:hypothetical protein